MKKDVFDKEHFKEEVRDHVKKLYRKTMDEASDQEIFQAVSYAVKNENVTELVDIATLTGAVAGLVDGNPARHEKGRPESGLLHVHGIFSGPCPGQ